MYFHERIWPGDRSSIDVLPWPIIKLQNHLNKSENICQILPNRARSSFPRKGVLMFETVWGRALIAWSLIARFYHNGNQWLPFQKVHKLGTFGRNCQSLAGSFEGGLCEMILVPQLARPAGTNWVHIHQPQENQENYISSLTATLWN